MTHDDHIFTYARRRIVAHFPDKDEIWIRDQWARCVANTDGIGDLIQAAGLLEAEFGIAQDPVQAAMNALTAELDVYCAAEGLPRQCAIELLHEDITEGQRRWLSDFVGRWEAVEGA